VTANRKSAKPTRPKRAATATKAFGTGKRESHDASGFYDRFEAPEISTDDDVKPPFELAEPLILGDARNMTVVPDNSVALVVTSPPYFAGKDYEKDLTANDVPGTYEEYLGLLRDVFSECVRVLEPGGRIAVNVANLGRKPYRSLASDVIRILQDDLGLLLRGEIVWQKAAGAGGNCAWGSFRQATNPVLRDLTERVVVASKGRFDRAIEPKKRRERGLPAESAITGDEFMSSTLDLWRLPTESATRLGHPAPFPVALPQRLIDLYTFEGDLVLDPFLGAGTTAVAAARRGRRYVGYELDPQYLAIAQERVAAASADQSDAYEAEALERGKGIVDIAKQVLSEAGFTAIKEKVVVRGVGITVPLAATDQAGERWLFDVSGGFTVATDGLRRPDVLWRSVGRAGIIGGATPEPVVLLTSHLPEARSAGDKALRTVGPGTVHDAIEVLSQGGRERLAAYATGGHHERPLPGFWADADLP
jgi:site-specific DNA-methyltransferase (adenine-specific)